MMHSYSLYVICVYIDYIIDVRMLYGLSGSRVIDPCGL